MYDISIIDQQIIKPNRITKLTTNKGIKIIKKIDTSIGEIKYIDHLNKISSKKIKTINILRNLNNSNYFAFNQSYYYVYDFIDGENINSKNKIGILEAIKALGMFHRYMQNLNIRIPKNRLQYDILVRNIKDVYPRIESLYNQMKSNKAEISNIFIKQNQYYKEQAIKTRLLLPSLTKHLQYSMKNQQVAHGDCGLRNFIKNRRGVYIIDIESYQNNTVIYDLQKFISSLHWRTDLIYNALIQYSEVSGCSRDVIILLLKLLNTPFEYVSYTTQYLRTGLDVYKTKLIDLIKNENKKVNSINTLLDYFES